jgi:hypothetical protein
MLFSRHEEVEAGTFIFAAVRSSALAGQGEGCERRMDGARNRDRGDRSSVNGR